MAAIPTEAMIIRYNTRSASLSKNLNMSINFECLEIMHR
jgi:hypothetical protein